jgi:molybdopterin converting factor small subunit
MAPVLAKIYTTFGTRLVKGSYPVNGTTVAEALESLAEKLGREFRDEVYNKGEVKNYHILLLNGQPVDREAVESIAVKDGDTIHIFPPVSGG